MTLIEMLSSIEDTRKRRGIRHKMPNFLIMCLISNNVRLYWLSRNRSFPQRKPMGVQKVSNFL